MNKIRIAVLVALAVASLQLGSVGLLPTPTASALTNCTVNDLSIDASEAEFLQDLNALRPGAPLTMAVELNRAASWHALDMMNNNRFDHIDSLGRNSFLRMSQCDAPPGSQAENIAAGYPTADDVMVAWRNSPGHNTNQMNTTYTYIGVARVCCGGQYGTYWVTTFSNTGTPMGSGGGGGAPSNVIVGNATGDSLNVYFNDNHANDAGIDIERRVGQAGAWAVVKVTTPLSGTQAGWWWPDSGLNGSTEYCYRLRARDANNVYTSYSNIACGTTTANALGAPSSVMVTGATASSLNVSFGDNATNETSIDLERRIGTTGAWGVVKTMNPLPGAQQGWYWPDSGLTGGTQYCYRLRAFNGATASAYSNIACGTTTGTPAQAPSGVYTGNPTASTMNVFFNDNAPDDTGIDIERRTGSGSFSVIKTTSPLPGTQGGWYWPDSGLNGSTQYCYRLRTRFANGTFSAYSTEACGTTLAGSSTVGAPSNVVVTGPTRTTLNVSFTDNATTETAVEIERRVGQNGTWTVVKTTTPLSGAQAGWYWPDSGLNPGTQYCYRLRARNGGTFSSYSNTGCGTTSP